MSTATDRQAPSAVKQASTIAKIEFKLITRSKAVLFSATAIPLLFAGFLILQREATREAGVALFSMSIVFFAMFTVYITATTTLVTRRQDLFLKRLRSGEASDTSILVGIFTTPVILCVGQALVVFVAMLAIGVVMPAAWWWIIVAFLGLVIVSITVAAGTAGLTPNPSAAQISTLPFTFVALGSLIASPMVDHRLMDLTPGGAIVTLCRLGYELHVPGSAGLAVAGLVLWSALGWELAKRTMRWEPRA